MAEPPRPTKQEQTFERAKTAANNEQDRETTARDQKTARLKAQRLARDAEKSEPKAKG